MKHLLGIELVGRRPSNCSMNDFQKESHLAKRVISLVYSSLTNLIFLSPEINRYLLILHLNG